MSVMETWMKAKRIVEKKGKQAFNNVDVYNGDWEDVKKDGPGKLTYGNGNVCVGD